MGKFRDRWHTGIANLTGDGTRLAGNLIASATRYAETEEQLSQAFNSVVGGDQK